MRRKRLEPNLYESVDRAEHDCRSDCRISISNGEYIWNYGVSTGSKNRESAYRRDSLSLYLSNSVKGAALA